MPHRVNTKGDIGTAKNASDSYDADNIYLSEEGWVYRHFKNSERTRWWDEILVAGQVKDGVEIHGVANSPVSQTNPLKLGTDDLVGYETGDCEFDISYANLGGDPELAHMDDMESVIIDPNTEKTYDPGASYRVFDAVQGTPDGWTSVSDPSNKTDYPDEPVYPGEDTFEAPANEYTMKVSPLPAPGADLEPAQVVVGEFESGTGGGYGAAQDPCSGGGGGGGTPPAPPKFDLEVSEGTGAPAADVKEGETHTYRVKATETLRTLRSTTTYEWAANNATIVGANDRATVRVLYDQGAGEATVGCKVIMTNSEGSTEKNIQIKANVIALEYLIGTVTIDGPDVVGSDEDTWTANVEMPSEPLTDLVYTWSNSTGNLEFPPSNGNGKATFTSKAFSNGDDVLSVEVTSATATDSPASASQTVSCSVVVLPEFKTVTVSGDAAATEGDSKDYTVAVTFEDPANTTASLNYAWTDEKGNATITNGNTATATVTFGAGDSDIKCVVSSPDVADDGEDTLSVTVAIIPYVENLVIVGDTVVEEGTNGVVYLANYDIVGNLTQATADFWEVTEGNATITTDPNDNRIEVSFPDDTDVKLKVTVSSPEIKQPESQEIDIVVNAKGVVAPIFNVPTITGDLTANEGDTKNYGAVVTFSGSETTSDIQYAWTMESGNGTLTKADEQECTVLFADEDVTLKVVISSVEVASDKENTASIVVTPTPDPVFKNAVISGDADADEGDSKEYSVAVTFDDSNNTTSNLDYLWTDETGNATLSNTTSESVTAVFGSADSRLKCVVSSDDVANPIDDTYEISVTAAPPAPIFKDITIAGDLAANEKDSKNYTAQVSFEAAQETTNLVWQWELVSGAGSTLTNANQATCNVEFGSDDVELKVTVSSPDVEDNLSKTINIAVTATKPIFNNPVISGDDDAFFGETKTYTATVDFAEAETTDNINWQWTDTFGFSTLVGADTDTVQVTFGNADAGLRVTVSSPDVDADASAEKMVAADSPPSPELEQPSIDGPRSTYALTTQDYEAIPSWTGVGFDTPITYQWDVAQGAATLTNETSKVVTVAFQAEGDVTLRVTTDSDDAPSATSNVATITVASAVPSWGRTDIMGPADVYTGEQHGYTAYYEATPSDPGDVTFAWTATTGDVSVDDATSATPKFTFNNTDPVVLQCTYNSVTIGSEVVETFDVTVTDAPVGTPEIVGPQHRWHP